MTVRPVAFVLVALMISVSALPTLSNGAQASEAGRSSGAATVTYSGPGDSERSPCFDLPTERPDVDPPCVPWRPDRDRPGTRWRGLGECVR